MKQALSELLERYYTSLVILPLKRRPRLTAETYRGKPRLFLSWLSAKSMALERVDTRSLPQYLDKRRNKDSLNPRSVTKSIAALRSLYEFFYSAVDVSWLHEKHRQYLPKLKKYET